MQDETTFCDVESESEMFCPAPKLSFHQEKDLERKINSSYNDLTASISIEIVISLDGVQKSLSIQYFRDKVKLFTPDQLKLIINVRNLCANFLQ